MADRHQIRANWHDYNGGIYFVTICCASRRHFFGEIRGGVMHLSETGYAVKHCVDQIVNHHKFKVEVQNYVIMPNHIHMVIYIDAVGAQYIAPAPSAAQMPEYDNNVNVGAIKPPAHGEPCGDNHFNSRLAIVVRTFKAAVSRMAASHSRAQCIAPLPIWQRNYHEHIIRNQRAYENIMSYIDENVVRWNVDCFNK